MPWLSVRLRHFRRRTSLAAEARKSRAHSAELGEGQPDAVRVISAGGCPAGIRRAVRARLHGVSASSGFGARGHLTTPARDRVNTVEKSGYQTLCSRSPLLACLMPPRRSARPKGQGRLRRAWDGLVGAIALPAADDLRRVVRRAVWQPRAVLRGLWVRLRAAWRERSE